MATPCAAVVWAVVWAVVAVAMACDSAWAQVFPSPCAFVDSWDGFVQVLSGSSNWEDINVTCSDPQNLMKRWSAVQDPAVAPFVDVILQWNQPLNEGSLSVGVWENSPPQSWVNLTFVDANDALLVVPVLVNVTYRGIPPTTLSAQPADPPATHVTTFHSGDVVRYAFAWSNVDDLVFATDTHLTPLGLLTTRCGTTHTDTAAPWADKLTAESCANGKFPCTRNLTFATRADDSDVGNYSYCLQEHNDFYAPYCDTTTAGVFPQLSTPTGGCVCVNFQVLSRDPTNPQSANCNPTPASGHGGGLTSGQIAAAVIIPIVGVAVLIGVAYWRQKSRSQRSDKGHVRMADDTNASLNDNL